MKLILTCQGHTAEIAEGDEWTSDNPFFAATLNEMNQHTERATDLPHPWLHVAEEAVALFGGKFTTESDAGPASRPW